MSQPKDLPARIETDDIRDASSLTEREIVTGGRDRGAERDASELLVTERRIALPPVQRIPPELLSEVFLACMPGHTLDEETWQSLDVSSTPWVLTQVSNSWRTVAISQTELWSYIRIDLEDIAQGTRRDPPLARLETWLQRSGDKPLRISFADSFRPTERAEEILIALMSHSHRWTQATLFVSFDHIYLTNRIKGRLPLLRHLDIGGYGALIYPTLDGFAIAPQLREVYLRSEWVPSDIPWFQLTKLGGEMALSPADIIYRCPSLISCRFKFSRQPSSTRLTLPPLIHSRIQHFETEHASILDDFTLPCLQELYVHPKLSETADLDIIKLFLFRSGGSLKKFSWREAQITELSIFISLLESIPGLEQLTISAGGSVLSWGLYRSLIESLAVTGPSCLLPNLKSIVLEVDKVDESSVPLLESFLSIVESRSPNSGLLDVSRLHEAAILKLRDHALSTGRTEERIKTLINGGTDFRYSFL